MKYELVFVVLTTACIPTPTSNLQKEADSVNNNQSDEPSSEYINNEGTMIGDCIDGQDNDGDGYIDCEDSGCFDKSACEQSENAPSSEQNYNSQHSCGFTPITNSKLSSYDCNPVFGDLQENWTGSLSSIGMFSSAETGHMMWYTSTPLGGNYGLGLATSSNGSDWVKAEENPLIQSEVGAWDQDSLVGQVILWNDIQEKYVMFYQGFILGTGEFDPNTFEVDNGRWGMGVATSTDGIVWEKSNENPVIDFFAAQFDMGLNMCWPLTMNFIDGVYEGYIAASNMNFESEEESKCEIYSLVGISETNWTVDTSAPVFSTRQSYDSMGVTSVSIVDFQGIHYMFYVGFSEWIQNSGYQTAHNMSLNLATSNNGGLTWTRDPNNPLIITNINTIEAQLVNEEIHLWAYNEDRMVDFYTFDPNIGSQD